MPSDPPTASSVCSANPPCSAADGADECSPVIAPAEWESAESAPTERLVSLQQLRLHGEWQDAEWWQARTIQAAAELCGDDWLLDGLIRQAELRTAWKRALLLLHQRRDELAATMDQSAAEAAVLQEIELCWRRAREEFSDGNPEEKAMATATKSKPARATAPRETDEQLLRRALRLTDPRWRPRQVNGAIDAEIRDLLAILWEEDRQAPQDLLGRAFAVRGAPHPAIWFDRTSDNVFPVRDAPSLIGDDLINAVRRAIDIGQPRQLDEKNRWVPVEEYSHSTETNDEVLRRALGVGAVHASRLPVERPWNRLRESGASDKELEHELKEFWVQCPGSLAKDGLRAFATLGGKGKHVSIWFDYASNGGRPADLHGKKLLQEVRRVLEIPEKRRPNLIKAAVDAAKAIAEPAPAAGPLRIEETRDIPLDQIRSSPYQTRDIPPAAWLQEIIDSMAADGQLTAALVRRVGDRFELIAGHTRFTAAFKLKWKTLRCDVSRCDNATAAKLVYLENAKRRDLTPIERARGLAKMRDEYKAAGLSQAQLAKDIGGSESGVSNQLRLLELPAEFQERLLAGNLTIDQARTLSTWSHRPKVFAAFKEKLKNYGVLEGPIDQHHFESGLSAALDAASRPMTRASWGTSCEFTPTAEEKTLLEIEDVRLRGQPATKRAFNLPLWGKLNKAAKARKAERKEKAEASVKAKPEKVARDQWSFENELATCWQAAIRPAIAARLKGKLNKVDSELIARAGELLFRGNLREYMTLGEAKFIDLVRKDCTRKLQRWEHPLLDFEDARFLAERLGVDAAGHFVPSKDLIVYCGDADLARIAADLDLDLTGLDRKARIAAIAQGWPRKEIPELLQLPKPKGKK
jgi:ParB/RepB/Spo0J family partition protein